MAKSKDIGKRLLELKEELEGIKTERSELQGELKSLMTQLKTEFNVQSIKEAEEFMEEEQSALESMEKNIREQLAEIEDSLHE